MKKGIRKQERVNIPGEDIIEKERWDEDEIKKAAKIFSKAENKKKLMIKILDEIVHWALLLIIICGNVLIAGFIVFLSGLLERAYFYILVILFAVLFGYMVEIPLRDIEKLSKHKHFLSRILLPFLALVNIYILIGVKHVIEHFSEIEFKFNAAIAGAVYGMFFLLPHFLGWILKRK